MISRNHGRRVAALGVVALGLALGGCGKPATETAAAPPAAKANVDGARIEQADSEPGSWLSHGRTYSEQRFSPLTQVDTTNVGKLGLAWFADLDTQRGQEATPLM